MVYSELKHRLHCVAMELMFLATNLHVTINTIIQKHSTPFYLTFIESKIFYISKFISICCFIFQFENTTNEN